MTQQLAPCAIGVKSCFCAVNDIDSSKRQRVNIEAKRVSISTQHLL
jgi:hypothetical protein